MNTARIKAYAIQARRDFIKAVTERANVYGIFTDDHIEPLVFKGDTAIIGERAFPKKEGDLREKLVSCVKRDGFTMVMRACAYTWFNRFVALRYMEFHDYLEHGYRVLSSSDGSSVPEIIEHATEVDLPGIDKEQVIALKLAGTRDNELYRLLVLAQCNALHQSMPFLFERIDSETELLLPDNLLFSDSPIRKMVTEIDEPDWNDVEIIGWIYQFYISERKDEVIGKVVKSEDIPAATQLFTPNWIVKYMLHNTLGRMWLATYPDSALKDKMAYYIEPAEQAPEVQKQLDEITPKELNPEAITLLDPACGSGHILVEAYDIFKEIYRERGYRTREIPRLILEKNLYGLDIDERAAQLACFAVLMKARADDRRIFKYENLQLNVCAIKESKPSDLRTIDLFFKGEEYQAFRADSQELAGLFGNAKTFGSLIAVPPHLIPKMPAIQTAVEGKIGKWVSKSDVQNVRALVQQAAILARQYDCVVTNPPYMGGKGGMNPSMKKFAESNFKNSKFDLFAMFTERSLTLAKNSGFLGFVMPYVWMFITSYEKFRAKITNIAPITSLIRLEYNAFEPACVPVAAFTLQKKINTNYRGGFIDLSRFRGHQNQAPRALEAIKNEKCVYRYTSSTYDFSKIPGTPIAYWVTDRARNIFKNSVNLGDLAAPRQGLATSDNNRFLRFWAEVSLDQIGFGCNSHKEAKESKKKWFPYNKGGKFRKWFGNNEFLINWENDGKELIEFAASLYGSPTRTIKNIKHYFQPSITWSALSSSSISLRYNESGFIFDTKGQCIFAQNIDELYFLMALLNSTVTDQFMKILAPTLDFNSGTIAKIPYADTNFREEIIRIAKENKKNAENDWDNHETSWNYKQHPLLNSSLKEKTLKQSFLNWESYCENQIKRMCNLETENNRLFIEAYRLKNEIVPQVSKDRITLTRSNKEIDIKSLISYAVGCMMGRYSLDQPGLIYANRGDEGFDPSKYRTFPADDDGIIPIMDRDWFADDAANRFVEFLKIAWPPETLDENLQFVANCLKPKRNEASIDTIRRYLSTGFFKDHLRTYKKRPIYWLLSSGRQKAFECLVYLHRYNESTLSRMRSTYVTPLQGNFSARLEFLQNEKDAAATASVQKKFQKEMGAALLRRPSLTVSGSLYCFIPDKLSYLITFR